MIRHKKLIHIEKVQLCIQFTDGDCIYGESCWSSHKSSGKKLSYEFKCNHRHGKKIFVKNHNIGRNDGQINTKIDDGGKIVTNDI